jgi:hypothetical protein
MKKLALIALIGLSNFYSFGQLQIPTKSVQQKQPITEVHNQKTCANHYHERLLQNDAQYRQAVEDNELLIQQIMSSPSFSVNRAVYTIPVVVHVIHKGEAIGSGTNISAAQIQSAINNMNAAFSNTSTPFTTYTGVDTEIQFCLAQRDPSNNPHSGINRVNGTSVTGYNADGITSTNELDVKALSNWNKNNYYNIWVVSEIDGNNAGAGTQGYAYFPGAPNGTDGTVILYNAMGYDPDGSSGYNLKSYTRRNTTLVHEVGHAMNLYHTFEGDGTGGTCPTNTDCATQGDRVCDTPPHRRSDSDCITAGTDCGSNRSDFVHNFMDYSSDVCQTEFTAGQRDRMRAAISGFAIYTFIFTRM